jgi:hypothetical protein
MSRLSGGDDYEHEHEHEWTVKAGDFSTGVVLRSGLTRRLKAGRLKENWSAKDDF